MWCPKISSSRSLCKGPVLYPAKNEVIYGIVPHQKFLCHVTLATFKKENFNMWVTSGSYVGHIRIVLWVKWVNRFDPLSILPLNIATKLVQGRAMKFTLEDYSYSRLPLYI